MSLEKPFPPLTVGEFLAHLESGRRSREFDNAPEVRTLHHLSLSWFRTNLTAATFKCLRFEGALRLGKYVDGEDDEGIDTVSVADLAVALRAARDRFSNLQPPPIEAIEAADAIVRGETAADGDARPTIWYHGEKSYSTDGTNPKTVSREQHNLLQAFLDKEVSLSTNDLEQIVNNPSKVIKDIGRKFCNGAVRRLVKRGDGHFLRVFTLEKK